MMCAYALAAVISTKARGRSDYTMVSVDALRGRLDTGPHRYQGISAVTINVAHPAWAMVTQPLVCVVDDDESVRESLPDLLRELGFAAKAFASAREFLASNDVSEARCLLLDVAMPDMSGPQLQRELTLRGIAIPIIFITARVDEVLRQRLIGQGAVECLFKPFSEQQLRVAIESALGPA